MSCRELKSWRKGIGVFFVLLWIATVASALYWLAMHAASIGRVKARPLRVLLLIIEVLIPLIGLGLFALFATNLKLTKDIEPTRFGCALSLVLAYVAGAILILFRGRCRKGNLRPTAAEWRVLPLAMGWLASSIAWCLIFAHMDRAVLGQYADARSRARARYLANMTPDTPQAATAAGLYKKAFARLALDPDTEIDNLPPMGSSDFNIDDPAITSYLTREQPSIAYLRQAATIPECRFDQDTAEPDISNLAPDGPQERQAGVLLGLDARKEVERGRVASAMTDIAAEFALARKVGQRSTVVQGLVGAGIDALASDALEAALPAIKSKDDLDPLHIDDLPPFSGEFQQALRGELWFDLTLFDMTTTSASPARINTPFANGPGLMSPGISGLAFVRVFYVDVDQVVQYMRTIEDISAQPYYKIPDQLRDIDQQRHHLGIGAIFFPSMLKALAAATRAETTESCARVAVAMTRYRLDHGAPPTKLDQLVPAYLDTVPIDPYDGNPLRLNAVGGALVIYSIGPDGMDNGGVPIDERTGQGDIIFTLRPAAASAGTNP